jgi:hypothetical protein
MLILSQGKLAELGHVNIYKREKSYRYAAPGEDAQDEFGLQREAFALATIPISKENADAATS